MNNDKPMMVTPVRMTKKLAAEIARRRPSTLKARNKRLRKLQNKK